MKNSSLILIRWCRDEKTKKNSINLFLFRSKDQQLELVSLEDFYAYAPSELTNEVRNLNSIIELLFLFFSFSY